MCTLSFFLCVIGNGEIYHQHEKMTTNLLVQLSFGERSPVKESYIVPIYCLSQLTLTELLQNCTDLARERRDSLIHKSSYTCYNKCFILRNSKETFTQLLFDFEDDISVLFEDLFRPVFLFSMENTKRIVATPSDLPRTKPPVRISEPVKNDGDERNFEVVASGITSGGNITKSGVHKNKNTCNKTIRMTNNSSNTNGANDDGNDNEDSDDNNNNLDDDFLKHSPAIKKVNIGENHQADVPLWNIPGNINSSYSNNNGDAAEDNTADVAWKVPRNISDEAVQLALDNILNQQKIQAAVGDIVVPYKRNPVSGNHMVPFAPYCIVQAPYYCGGKDSNNSNRLKLSDYQVGLTDGEKVT